MKNKGSTRDIELRCGVRRECTASAFFFIFFDNEGERGHATKFFGGGVAVQIKAKHTKLKINMIFDTRTLPETFW